MRKLLMLTIIATLFNVSTAEASLAVTAPSSACALLDDIGLAAGSWKNIYGNEFGCSSTYKEIGTGFPLANNLAYYVDGTRDSVTEAKLVLNVNVKSKATSAHAALLDAGKKLSMGIIGVKLSQATKDAIVKGKSIKTKLDQTTVEVKRHNWPNGKGYEIHVIFN